MFPLPIKTILDVKSSDYGFAQRKWLQTMATMTTVFSHLNYLLLPMAPMEKHKQDNTLLPWKHGMSSQQS